MKCVYTGAKVFFVPYGMLVAADIFDNGTVAVIRWNTNSAEYPKDTAEYPNGVLGASHSITWQEDTDVWHRSDLGVTVCSSNLLYGPRR